MYSSGILKLQKRRLKDANYYRRYAPLDQYGPCSTISRSQVTLNPPPLSFRAQRHDFRQHLQTIRGLIKIGDLQSVQSYIDDFSPPIQLIDLWDQLRHPALAALLNSKLSSAKEKGILFDIDIQASLQHMKTKPYDLVRIAGNVIDNALDEELKAPAPERYIKIKVDQMTPTLFVIKIYNRNSYLSSKEQEQIFQYGFTTKLNHSGLGLPMSLSLLEHNGGHIAVESEPRAGTTFTLFIP
jgi:sensor histidine kinase regulating citrate/malate metabolism